MSSWINCKSIVLLNEQNIGRTSKIQVTQDFGNSTKEQKGIKRVINLIEIRNIILRYIQPENITY